MASVASLGGRMTLGFECPQFWPCPESLDDLGRQRSGESGRAWSAGAGATITPTGGQALAWLLRRLASSCPGLIGTTRWEEFTSGKARLFLWEAFASNKPKTTPHDEDARLILSVFLQWVEAPDTVELVTSDEAISLAGMLLLWSRLSTDSDLLREPCLAVKVRYPETVLVAPPAIVGA